MSVNLRPSRVGLIAFALIAVAMPFMPQRASASPLFELVGSDEAGFAGRASPAGARSAYFNPALLLDADTGASVGYLWLAERLDVTLGARSSSRACRAHACDVPEVNGAGPESFRHADGSAIDQPTLPTKWLQEGRPDGDGSAFDARPRQAQPTGHDEHGYLSLGLVQAPIAQRFAYGITALIPLSDFMHTDSFYSDEREQFFSNSLHHELYGDRLTSGALAFGLGVRIVPALSVGASLGLNIASTAAAQVYVSNLADLDSLLIDSDVNVAVSLAPNLGVSLTPFNGLRLTATVHSPQGTEIETGFSYIIATGIEQRATQSFEHGYLPWTFGLGAELTLGTPQTAQWMLAASSTYALWSDYRDRHAEQPRAAYAWSDMFNASLAARYRVRQIAALVSATYEPTPVPTQTGRTNYVDSDRLGAALGGSYDFDLFHHVATFGLQAQLHRLIPRDTHKRIADDAELVRDEVPDDAVGGTPRGAIAGRDGLQTNNPGFPSFSSQGWIVGAGARFSLAY